MSDTTAPATEAVAVRVAREVLAGSKATPSDDIHQAAHQWGALEAALEMLLSYIDEQDQPRTSPDAAPAEPVDEPDQPASDQPRTTRERAYERLQTMLGTAENAVAFWCDDVRQDVEKRLGIGPTDERALHDPEYGSALDVLGLVSRAQKALERAGRTSSAALRPRVDVDEPDQPAPDQPRTSCERYPECSYQSEPWSDQGERQWYVCTLPEGHSGEHKLCVSTEG